MTEYKIYEHHKHAARHYEQAAKHHREPPASQAGNHEKAAHHCGIAFGHYLKAAERQNGAARQHARQQSGTDAVAVKRGAGSST